MFIGANYSSRESISYLAHGQDHAEGQVQFYDPEIDGFLDSNGDYVPGSNPDKTPQFGTVLVPDTYALGSKSGKRDRFGLNANIEYRPNENTSLWFRGYYTSYTDDFVRPETKIRRGTTILDNRRGRLTSPTTGYGTRSRASIEHFFRKQERPVHQLVFGGKQKFGDAWEIEGNINFTNAVEEWPDGSYRLEGLPSCDNRDLGKELGVIPEFACMTYDFSDPTFPVFEINEMPEAFRDHPDASPWPNSGNTIGDPAFWPVTRIRFDTSHIEEDTWTADINLKWNVREGSFIKFGYKRLERDKSVDDTARQFFRNQSGAPVVNYTDTAGAGSAGGFGINHDQQELLGLIPFGPAAFRSQFGPVSNIAGFLDDEAVFIGTPNPYTSPSFDVNDPSLDIDDNKDALFPAGSPYTFDLNGSRGNSVEDDYVLNEIVDAAYIMGSVDFGERFNVIGGVRVEWTTGTVVGFPVFRGPASEGSGGVQAITATKDYETVLPSVQFKWDSTDNIVVRGSYTTNLSRPDYRDISPGTRGRLRTSRAVVLDDVTGLAVEQDYFTGDMRGGNPGLSPYGSKSYALSATYYFGDGSGLLSVGYFYKDIDGAIYTFEFSPTDEQDPNRERPIDALPIARSTVLDTNGDSHEVVTIRGVDFEEFDVETVSNADAGFVEGIEFTLQKNFDFLPAPLDGFGVVANMAFMDSGVRIQDRPDEDLPFFQQPDRVFNIQGYYQKGKLEARLAWRLQGVALTVVEGSAARDVNASDYKNLDFKLSYQFNERLGMYFSVKNITDEPLRHHVGDITNTSAIAHEERPGYEIYGTTYYVGMTWNFGRR